MLEVMTPQVLVVEDEKNVGSTLVERLKKEGFKVRWVSTVATALTEIHTYSFEMAILDVGLKDGSGFEIAAALRKVQPGTAVIFLTAFGNAEDRIRGLELGAEDYVVKPFHLKELILRMRNALKRAHFVSPKSVGLEAVVQVGKAKVHFLRFEVEIDHRFYPLSHKEVALLKLLTDRRGQVVSRDEILNHAWSEDDFPTPRTVDNFIMRLRRLVEVNPEEPEVIKSIRGIGYQLI